MRKKILLFIVEGDNDQREIQAMLNTPYFGEFSDKYVYRFLVTKGDITQKKDVSSKTIRGKLDNLVRNWRKYNEDAIPYSPADIKEVIQIIDTDATFIPQDRIYEEPTAGDFIYKDTGIYNMDVNRVTNRNGTKSKVLREMLSFKTVDNILYSVYFVSCDMDHLLSGSRNATQKYKDRYSFDFRNLLKSNPKVLENSVFHSEYCSPRSYESSWVEIQKGMNSIMRKTNLNLFFSEKAKNQK